MSLSSRSIERPVAVTMLFAAVVFLGVISFTRLPIDLLPDVSYPKLVIYTSYRGLAPVEVERLVTSRIENAVSRVPGRERIESVSREGISLVTIHFAWGTNMDFAAIAVRERLDNMAGLPDQADRPVVLRTDPNAEPIMAISVAGDADLYALKELADAVFRRRLEQIDGVAQAAVTGGEEREIRVEVDPRLLEAYDLSIQQISQAIRSANAAAAGGTILRDRLRYPMRALGEFQVVSEIGDVVLGRRPTNATAGAGAAGLGLVPPGGLIRLRDVATIEDGFRERESVAYYDGEPAVGLLLFKEAGANTVEVARQVDEVLAQLREQYPEVRTEVAMSQAGFITDSIANVVQALVYGGVLAFLVLFLFLRDPRYPVAVSLAIPISVVATFGLLHAAGVSLNIMSLGGLALGVGMLVDNSIVVLENTFRHRELGQGPAAAAALGAEEVQGAITASTLTTISVFGPIIYVEGVAGELFGAVSYAVAFSLLVSLVVALTLLPMMAARWGSTHDEDAGFIRRRFLRPLMRVTARSARAVFAPPLDAFDGAFQRFAERYHALLERSLERRGLVVAVGIIIVAGGFLLGLTLDRAVLPAVDQGSFVARIELPLGTTLEQTAELARRVEGVLRADPGVAAVFTRVGRQGALSGITDDETGINTALLETRLRDGERTSDVVERIQPLLAGIPPGVLSIETGKVTSLGRLLGGGEADLAVRVRGDDLDAVLAHAAAVQRRLSTVPELRNVRLGAELGQPEVRVEVDRERAAAYGIEATAVVNAIAMYMGGETATEFVAFDRKIPVRVQLPEEWRRSIETLGLLRASGVPLHDLVRTTNTMALTEVKRVSQARVVPVYADAATRGLEDAVAAIQTALADVPPPPRVRVEIGGENEELRRSFRDLGFAFLLAMILVYMIMAAQFESLIHPFTILLSVPLGIAGAIAALWLTGSGLNSMSLIGMVVLVGIAVNDAIVKVDFINQARRRGLPLREAILDAGRARLRPILMTTVTTVLGLLPMALGIGRGADLRAPLAVALIGGLISSTALTLIIVPVAYDLIEHASIRVRRLLGRPEPALVSEPVPATATTGGAGQGGGGGTFAPAGGAGAAHAFRPPSDAGEGMGGS